MDESQALEAARKRAKAKVVWYRQALIYAAISLLLLIINLVTSPSTLWFYWPMLGMAIALAFQGIKVFGSGATWDRLEDRLVEKELAKQKERQGD